MRRAFEAQLVCEPLLSFPRCAKKELITAGKDNNLIK